MRALPAVARRVSSNPDAYVYLAESIRAWPDQAALARAAAAGWGDVQWRNLSGGIVALHRPTSRPESGRPHRLREVPYRSVQFPTQDDKLQNSGEDLQGIRPRRPPASSRTTSSSRPRARDARSSPRMGLPGGAPEVVAALRRAGPGRVVPGGGRGGAGRRE